ncbi:general secretion pathway protein GspN [Lysobacter sp. KIS68-7]|uniref:general secretion pathway protein GspN n=1 Tax=Lysobacter sp. KIS68-7 TaxID=2904252 RepID=UPI001E627A54|nr:general secretion pathway protein GspN [Lysobacter sp. KIS68-7]UHQ19958.1 general secretion pathway protein GspN [Lysobacter sp. KIS68-7]
MRLSDAGPRTWLLASVAGWALLTWVGALAGMGGTIARLPNDPSLLRKLPVAAKAQAERIGPLSQYAEVGARPLFSEDRRPQPFFLQAQGDDQQAQAFDFVLTSVLLTPTFRMAIVQPTAGGESVRMKMDESPAEAQGWRLVALEPRRATFEGPQGSKTLDLRVFNGAGGTAPTRTTPTAAATQEPPQPVVMENADDAVPPPPAAVPAPAPEATANKPATTGSTLPDQPMTPEQQMDAIRKRIEQRRAQLRQEQQRQPQQNKQD